MDSDLVFLIQTLVGKNYITVDDIMLDTNVSRRQVVYRMDKLNQLLDHNQEKVSIAKSGTIHVPSQTKLYLKELLYNVNEHEQFFFNKQERMYYIYLLMFIKPEYVGLQDFIHLLEVSRSTILGDIKDLSDQLQTYQIRILNNRSQGYYLAGHEADIRSYMMNVVFASTNNQTSIQMMNRFIDDFHLEIYQYSKLVIDELAHKHHVAFVEDRLQEFIYIFIFLKTRVVNHGSSLIEPYQADAIFDNLKEYQFTEELLHNFKDAKKIPKDEMHYIVLWILGVSVGNIDEETSDCLEISDVTMKIIFRFEALSGVQCENVEEVFIRLYGHIRPAYYRILLNIPIYNPLTEKIKEEYTDLFQLVKESIQTANVGLDRDIPEAELAYLTMHFSTIFKNSKTPMKRRKKALIVCGNGIGSSVILYNELTHLFPELEFLFPIELNQLPHVEMHVDVIFSTVYYVGRLKTETPIIKVSPVMSGREKFAVLREVHMLFGSQQINRPNVDVVMSKIQKYADIKDKQNLYNELLSYFADISIVENQEEHRSFGLLELIDEKYIQLQEQANNRSDAIRKSFRSMVHDGAVSENYVEKIIEDVDRLGPYIVITKHVALPHTTPDHGGFKTCMGITVLKEPIVFSSEENDPVKYIFTLCSTNNREHLTAMNELIDLLARDAFYQLMDYAKSPSEVYKGIANILNEA